MWDTNLPPEDQVAFFTGELAHVHRGSVVVALGHDSPSDALAEQLAALGVNYLFTGHWHANRRVERRGLVEWGTQTLVMGTIDQSPSGYRVVTFLDGVPTVEHRARLVEPELAITNPHAGSCASPAGFDLLVSAAFDAAIPNVTARIDCGSAFRLVSRGGWSFGARVPSLALGVHEIDVTGDTPSGRGMTQRIAFEVCTPPETKRLAADWPQLGGGPLHTNATDRPIVPPLQQAWATAVGGNILLGTPVIANGVVVVALWDLGAGDRGGVVALDLATGAERWRHGTPLQTRAAPAIAKSTVVIALATGELQAVSLEDGALRWTADVAHGLETNASSLWGSPTIADGFVYVAVQGRMSALDLDDGSVRWEHDLPTPSHPWLGSLAAVTVADGVAVANYGRVDGMTAWHADAALPQWRLTSPNTNAINATPIARDGTLYFASSRGVVTSIDLATSTLRWSVPLVPKGDDWDYAITATPALAGDRLLVPTQRRDLIALDRASGNELWRWATAGGPLNFTHYRAAEPGFAASAVVTGSIVWVPGPDGVLTALSIDTGRRLWSTHLGAPIVSAPAPAGDYLVVATFDGTVRALVAAPERAMHPTPTCSAAMAAQREVIDAGGCCNGTPSSPPLGIALLLLIRRRCCRFLVRSRSSVTSTSMVPLTRSRCGFDTMYRVSINATSYVGKVDLNTPGARGLAIVGHAGVTRAFDAC